MGIRCSVFGCEYEGTEIEREEERRGSEVVMTVREYEECVHCGNVRIVSENTGVTAADPAAGVSSPGGSGTDESPDAGDVIVEAEPDAAADGGPDDGHRAATGAGDATDAGPAADAPDDPGEVTDDAVFIGEDGEDTPAHPEETGDPAVGESASDPDGPGDASDPGDVEAPDRSVEPHPDDDVEIIDAGPSTAADETPPAEAAGGPDDRGGESAGTDDPDRVAAGDSGEVTPDDSGEADPGDSDEADPDDFEWSDAGDAEETASADAGDDDGGSDPADSPGEAAPGDWEDREDPDGASDGDAEIVEDEPPSLAEAISEAEGEVTDATDRPDDDAVIIDDGSADRPDRREPETPNGAVEGRDWPTFEADDSPDLSAQYDDWPEGEGEDEGYAARPEDPADVDPAGSAEFVGGSPDADAGVTAETGGGTGATAADSGGAGEAEVDPDGVAATRAAPRPGGPRTTEDWTTSPGDGEARELHCPECGESWSVAETPHRAGDCCPDCSRGYLTEH